MAIKIPYQYKVGKTQKETEENKRKAAKAAEDKFMSNGVIGIILLVIIVSLLFDVIIPFVKSLFR